MHARDQQPMRQNRLLIGITSICITVTCGPIGWNLLLAFQVAPLPKWLHPLAVFLFMSCWILPLAWFPIALLSPLFALTAVFVKPIRPYLFIAILVWFFSWASFPVSRQSSFGRNWGLERITVQAEPLIKAIETHKIQKGEYPPDLEALLPEYIAEIPYTGAVGYPDFEYSRGESENYQLLVHTPMPGINFDVFVYWPKGNYPPEMYGGSVESIKDWAYVHE